MDFTGPTTPHKVQAEPRAHNQARAGRVVFPLIRPMARPTPGRTGAEQTSDSEVVKLLSAASDLPTGQ